DGSEADVAVVAAVGHDAHPDTLGGRARTATAPVPPVDAHLGEDPTGDDPGAAAAVVHAVRSERCAAHRVETPVAPRAHIALQVHQLDPGMTRRVETDERVHAPRVGPHRGVDR